MKLNVKQLITDLGGPRDISTTTGLPRTSIYRILKAGSCNSSTLEKFKAFYEFDLNSYFEEASNEDAARADEPHPDAGSAGA